MRVFIDILSIVANISATCGVIFAVIIYKKTKKYDKEKIENEIKRKDNIVSKEIDKVCNEYSDIVSELTELSRKTEEINANYVSGTLDPGKRIAFFVANKESGNHYALSIYINNYGQLNNMLFNGILLSEKSNLALEKTIDACSVINKHIDSSYSKIIFNDNIPIEAKIVMLTGYHNSELYKQHKKLISDARELLITH